MNPEYIIEKIRVHSIKYSTIFTLYALWIQQKHIQWIKKKIPKLRKKSKLSSKIMEISLSVEIDRPSVHLKGHY